MSSISPDFTTPSVIGSAASIIFSGIARFLAGRADVRTGDDTRNPPDLRVQSAPRGRIRGAVVRGDEATPAEPPTSAGISRLTIEGSD
jgi:hypothetical protein